MKRASVVCCGLSVLLLSLNPLLAQVPEFTRTEDIVYGRKHGLALTLDVLQPKEKANGAAVIWIISGGWFSSHEGIAPARVSEFIKRGYTVFAVVHGSQPRFTIPEAVADVQRSIRYIKHNAKQWNVDPERIGVTGASAGGHLSLMVGTYVIDANATAKDPVDRQSTRVRAVGCYFPPTDFFNYGKPGENALGRGILENFKAPFAFLQFDPKTRTYSQITDQAEIAKVGRDISPVNFVTKDDAPALIIHGDADKLVPIQQAEIIVALYEKAGVPTKLVRKPGQAHGWPKIEEDQAIIADWFDEHLKKR